MKDIVDQEPGPVPGDLMRKAREQVVDQMYMATTKTPEEYRAYQEKLPAFVRLFPKVTYDSDTAIIPLPYGDGRFVIRIEMNEQLRNGIDAKRVVVVDTVTQEERIIGGEKSNLFLFTGEPSLAFISIGRAQAPVPRSWVYILELGHEEAHLHDETMRLPETVHAMIKLELYKYLSALPETEMREMTSAILEGEQTPDVLKLLKHLANLFQPFGYSDIEDILSIIQAPYTVVEHDAIISTEDFASKAGILLIQMILDFMGDAVPEEDRESILRDARRYSSDALQTYAQYERYIDFGKGLPK